MVVLDTYDRSAIGPAASREVEATYNYLGQHNPNNLRAQVGWFDGAWLVVASTRAHT
jgi:hypothetical protein